MTQTQKRRLYLDGCRVIEHHCKTIGGVFTAMSRLNKKSFPEEDRFFDALLPMIDSFMQALGEVADDHEMYAVDQDCDWWVAVCERMAQWRKEQNK